MYVVYLYASNMAEYPVPEAPVRLRRREGGCRYAWLSSSILVPNSFLLSQPSECRRGVASDQHKNYNRWQSCNRVDDNNKRQYVTARGGDGNTKGTPPQPHDLSRLCPRKHWRQRLLQGCRDPSPAAGSTSLDSASVLCLYPLTKSIQIASQSDPTPVLTTAGVQTGDNNRSDHDRVQHVFEQTCTASVVPHNAHGDPKRL